MINLKKLIDSNNKIDIILANAGDENINYNLINGFLVNEAFEVVMAESNIDLLISNEKVAILVQNEDIFAVDYSKSYLKINTLREITSIE